MVFCVRREPFQDQRRGLTFFRLVPLHGVGSPGCMVLVLDTVTAARHSLAPEVGDQGAGIVHIIWHGGDNNGHVRGHIHSKRGVAHSHV